VYENVGFRIQFGFNLMSMLMAYAFNTGPLQPSGEIVSSWLILPMLAVMPIIHMIKKEIANAPSGLGFLG
jgi:hypothetical protein